MNMKRIVTFVLSAVILLSQSTVSWAESSPKETALEQMGYGTGSVLGSAVYFPFKASFCILGGIASAFSLPFGGARTAGNVASASCGGTWAITPDVVKGKERVHFVGGGPAGGGR
jgi:hypothetical protein